MKKSLLILASFLLLGFSTFTQLSFISDNCEGSHMHQYDLGNRTSVEWELYSGTAEFTQGDHYLSISSAADGTVFKQLNYYSSRETPVIEYYAVNLPENCNIDEEPVVDCVDESIIDNTVFLPTVWEPVCGCNGVTYSTASHAYYRGGVTNFTEGECPKTEEPVVEEPVNEELAVVTIDQGRNGDVIECDQESMWIHALVNGETPTRNDEYKFLWSSEDDGITLWKSTSSSALFMITTPGEKVIDLEVYTESGELIGTNEIVFTSSCTQEPVDEEPVVEEPADEEKYYLSGKVKAGEQLWKYGKVYLYDIAAEKIVDSQVLDYGAYTFYEISPGTFTVYAVPYTDASLSEVSQDYLTTYYANELSIEEANTIEITEDTYWLELQLKEAVDEEPTDEEPVNEQPVDEEPVGEEPVDEDPVVEEPADEERYYLSGKVKAGEELWKYGKVYLYDIAAEETIDSKVLDHGAYTFYEISPGTYTVYVVPYVDASLTEVSADYLTTYYANELSIEEANTIEITEDTYWLELQLKEAEESIIASLDSFSDANVSTYPNPFSDELNIESDLAGTEITVLNSQGTVIYNGVMEQLTNVNTSDWENGVYFIEVKTQSGTKTLKVLK